MKIKEILKVYKNSKLLNDVGTNCEINKIELDSRNIEARDLYLAIKGEKADGHDYIKDVIDKVSGIIVTKEIDIQNFNKPIILIDNYILFLEVMATYIREKNKDIPLIAITGSVGKTTTKELISQILEKKYKILKTSGNLNNEIGMPQTLFKLRKSHEIVVLELGMNHAGEIKKLSKICKPDVAVITNIGTSHIGNLGSKKNIFKAKMEITSYLDNGTLIINTEDEFLKKLKNTKRYDLIKCGTKNFTYREIKVTDALEFTINYQDKDYKVIFKIPNIHLMPNILIAIEVGLKYNVDIEDIIDAIKDYKTIQNRLNIIDLNNSIKLIDDCYNASFESIKSSIDTLKNISDKRMIIIADILELGKYSEKIHKSLNNEMKKIDNTTVLTVGMHTKHINSQKHFENNNQLIEYLETINLKNLGILVKGSHSMHLEEITSYLKEKYKNN